MRVLLIANPNSTFQSASVMRQVFPLLGAVEGAEYLVKFTQRPGHARDMVQGLTKKDFAAVVAVGGDGTVNEVLNGLLGRPRDNAPDPDSLPLVGVIPTGSANVFVRALGFSGHPVEAARELAEAMTYDLHRGISLGTWKATSKTNPHANKHAWFAVNAGFGLDAEVLAMVDKQRARGRSATPLRYLALTLRAWRKALKHPPSIDVVADNGIKQMELHGVPLMLASNTNPWTFLGPLPVVTNPRNSFDEGLALFGLHGLRGFSGFAGMLHLFGAYHLSQKQVIEFDDAKKVRLAVPHPYRFQVDGESVGSFDQVELASFPDAIRVLSP